MTNKIIMVRGDTQNIDVLITNEDGTNHLITDKETCLFTVKKSYADERILIEKDVKSNGTVNTFKLDPIDTSDMELGGYCYDVQLTLENGDVYTVVPCDEFILAPEVTWQ